MLQSCLEKQAFQDTRLTRVFDEEDIKVAIPPRKAGISRRGIKKYKVLDLGEA